MCPCADWYNTQEFNGLITMSDTAKFIWENPEKADGLHEMIDMLLEEYQIDEETVRQNMVRFISRLVQAGFVEYKKEEQTW